MLERWQYEYQSYIYQILGKFEHEKNLSKVLFEQICRNLEFVSNHFNTRNKPGSTYDS